MTTITTSDGIRLDVRSTGSGAPLVFVHEFSGDARSWEPQIGYFSRYFRCTAYCARGYPPSDVPTGPEKPTIKCRAAEDLADVVRAVCARSGAYRAACRWAALPRYISALRHRAACAVARRRGCRLRRQAGTAAEVWAVDARGSRSCGEDRYGRICPRACGSGYAQCLRAKDEDRLARFADQLAEHSVLGMAMTLRGVLATRPSLWHLADELRALNMPILLVAGDEDTPCLEPNLFSRRRCPMRRYASCRAPGICSIWKSPRCSTRSYSGSSRPSSAAAGAHGGAASLGASQGGKSMSGDRKAGRQGSLGHRGQPRSRPRHCGRICGRRRQGRRQLSEGREGRQRSGREHQRNPAATPSWCAPTSARSTTSQA